MFYFRLFKSVQRDNKDNNNKNDMDALITMSRGGVATRLNKRERKRAK
jgi:hypothetical protein